MNWTDLKSAPAAGTPVARAADVDGVVALTVETAAGAFPLLLVRLGDQVMGYVNMCPHQGLPLTYRSPRLLSKDGTKLMCSAHGAMFDAATGTGLAGEGLGCALMLAPLAEESGQITVAG